MQTDITWQTLDNRRQAIIEKEVLPYHLSLKDKNLTYFSLEFPNLYQRIKKVKPEKYSVFINCNRKINIVNVTTGETLYPLNPEESQIDHVKHSSIYDLKNTRIDSDDLVINDGMLLGLKMPKPASVKSGTLIGLGSGLGHSYQYIAENYSYKNLIIIEPDIEVFLATIYSIDWKRLHELLSRNGGNLAFLIESENSVLKDIHEILDVFETENSHIYQHLHYPEFDAFISLIQKNGFSYLTDESVYQLKKEFMNVLNVSPLFSHTLSEQLSASKPVASVIDMYKTRFYDNIDSFKNYFPEIAEAFENYKPKRWLLLPCKENKTNIYNVERQAFWYGINPEIDALSGYNKFLKSPVQTLPSSGIDGGKLGHYTFYRFAKSIYEKFNFINKGEVNLPERIPSLLLISGGLGYSQQKVLIHHEVDYLLYYEPNPDFFYWSLYTIDWFKILKSFDDNGKQVNFSIGDDGTNLLSDVKKSMSKIDGFYLLNSFLFIDRKIPPLEKAIYEFREEMVTSVALSEHFHYARYALSHCIKNFSKNGTLINISSLENEISLNAEVLIVGNGPSIDLCWESLKKNKDKFLIVSCGTALAALWRNGIKPDFHAEVEQNKCTYSIISSIPDTEYLKSINLLAPVWVHPETVALFNKHYGMFTSLGGGMEVINYFLLKNNLKPPITTLSSPTVSNLALSAILHLGFKNITLVGVDMGFKDISSHHSKYSEYYSDKGGEKFSYSDSVDRLIPVKGNKISVVYTKMEFYLAIKNLSRVINKHPGARVFNISDGAYIEGTRCLGFDWLDEPSYSPRREVVLDLESVCFSKDCGKKLGDELLMQVRNEDITPLSNELKSIISLLSLEGNNMKVLSELKQFVIESLHKGNLIFYSLFSPVIPFISVTVMKALEFEKSTAENSGLFVDIIDHLNNMIDEMTNEYCANPLELESTTETQLVGVREYGRR
ncbi:6-hydroxymethylpterin diphosphokinase MptE-like protein [Idiomarina aquatica]|uniref:Motility associated factor glycosyltransferase family protein n=1 Tax=Idiomarina aquatica TaxID=1327752 RepID=A0AA94JDW7_9GAMM|nr:6-hydroxymethylpterin diphosphokinase MptE-like protein [Idiomarina aquatica]RUO45063.1 hypothetical protein CWE23_03310 [Idiomarina aquatica]